MTNNNNFNQAFDAELNKRLGIGATEIVNRLSSAELASAEPLLIVAERLQNAPLPTLSASVKVRIENQLQDYLVNQPVKPTRIQRLPRWQLLVAGLALIFGMSAVLVVLNSEPDKSMQVTQIAQATDADTSASTVIPSSIPTELPYATVSLPTTTAPTTENTEGPNFTPTVINDDYPLNTPTSTRDIEIASSENTVLCGNDISYWQDNPALWSLATLTIGNQTYAQTELLAILEAGSQDDASLLLARAVIIAYLNGSSDDELAEANHLLQDYTGKLPFAIDVTDSAGRAMINTANNLQPITSDCVTVTPIDPIGTDPDNCKNPPPDHANAQGWRERCEEGADNGNSGNGNSGNGNNGNGNSGNGK